MLLEDEPPAMAQLEAAVRAAGEGVEIVGRAETVRDAARLLRAPPPPDLIFADIHLADGSALRLFEEADVACPVVFATAYDAYLLKAFQLNAIDYLLKPIEPARVAAALGKYRRLQALFADGRAGELAAQSRLEDRVRALARPEAEEARTRSRLLVRRGAEFVAVPVERVAWFVSEHKLTVLVDRDGGRFLLDETLAELEGALDPRRFFRANRQILVHADAVKGFRLAGKGRLSLTLSPRPDDDVIVSQERAAQFKAWVEGRG